jgi:hypothetical protein
VVTSCEDQLHVRYQSDSLTGSPVTHETPTGPYDPDNDWDNCSQTLGAAVLYTTLIYCIIFFFCVVNVTANILRNLVIYHVAAVIGFASLPGMIILAMTIETELSKMPRWLEGSYTWLTFAYSFSVHFFSVMIGSFWLNVSISEFYAWYGTFILDLCCCVLHYICCLLSDFGMNLLG